jgi:hypothetical protein
MKLSCGKLQFWERKKTLLVLEHSVPRPYWQFTLLYAGRVFRPEIGGTFCRADAGRFRKSLNIKISRKNAEDSPHGEGKSRT